MQIEAKPTAVLFTLTLSEAEAVALYRAIDSSSSNQWGFRDYSISDMAGLVEGIDNTLGDLLRKHQLGV